MGKSASVAVTKPSCVDLSIHKQELAPLSGGVTPLARNMATPTMARAESDMMTSAPDLLWWSTSQSS